MKLKLFVILFMFSVLNACRATPEPNDSNQETNDLKAVIQKWVDLLDAGKLPGMSKDDHGNTYGYPLNKDMKKLLLDKKTVDSKMLSDVKNYNNAYVVGTITTDNRNYAYFFYVEKGDVELVSAYQYKTNMWVKIRR
jgi:hypothetical protein